MRRPSRAVVLAGVTVLVALTLAAGFVGRASHTTDKRISKVVLLSAGTAPPPSPTATTTPPADSRGIAQANGASPGLYGGVRGQSSCDIAGLVSSLRQRANVAATWAANERVRPQDIGALVDTFTPALLRVDTRVTHYTATGHSQAVVQAGTAVLVDRGGYPRVRCASGSALGRPRPVASHPRYVGTRWAGFSPAHMITVGPATAGAAFVLLDVNTGAPFARIPGSSPVTDIDWTAGQPAPSMAEPGGSVAFNTSGWRPGTAVTVNFDDPAGVIGTGTADGAGNVRLSAVVPAAARPGPHQLTSSGGGVTVKQTVYVLPPAPQTAS